MYSCRTSHTFFYLPSFRRVRKSWKYNFRCALQKSYKGVRLNVTHINCTLTILNSSPPEVSLRKYCPEICSKFSEEHPCRSVILQNNFIEIVFRHMCVLLLNCGIFSEHLFLGTPLGGWLLYFPSANSKGFAILHLLRKVVHLIFSSFFFSFSSFWLELCASKCCKCFKELSLLIRRRQSFLWNAKTLIQGIYNNILFSPHKVFIKTNTVIHFYVVYVRTAKDARCKIQMRHPFLSQKW